MNTNEFLKFLNQNLTQFKQGGGGGGGRILG